MLFFVTAVSLAGKFFYFCYPVLTYRVSAIKEISLRKGMILTMSDLQRHIHGRILEANNVYKDVCNRKTLKPLTQILIPEVEFHRPPKANESDRLSIKKTRDTTIHLVEKKSSNDWSCTLVTVGNQNLHKMSSVFSGWPVWVFCQFRGLFLHPIVECFTILQRALWWQFLKS